MKKELEIETKYRIPEDRNPIEFELAFLALQPKDIIHVEGYDTFYSSKKDKNSFFRYRESSGDIQLTFKRRTSKKDNIVRVEHNLDLILPLTDKGIDFCESMGYEKNTTIYKKATVFLYKDFIACRYTVSKDEFSSILEEFIEIEVKSENVTKHKALKRLFDLEKKFGLTKEDRVKESLFELFRRK